MKTIKLAVVGIGNCTSALVQSLYYYKYNETNRVLIGGYATSDIEIVLCYDIDKRKVGKPLEKAILQSPNCTPIYVEKDKLSNGPIVKMGKILDGISNHMDTYPDNEKFIISDQTEPEKNDIVNDLKYNDVNILVNFLPVGSEIATRFYVECCLEANVSFLNCIPSFISSNLYWEQKFVDKHLLICGDDIKSLFGASILSQTIQNLAISRGCKITKHIQMNIGSNTDFSNMTNQKRLKSKKISKENVIRSQNKLNDILEDDTYIYAGPSTYLNGNPNDMKTAYVEIEMEGCMGSPIKLDMKLQVVDSPNSAGIVLDAVRYIKVAAELGICGSLRGVSAFLHKTPPFQMPLDEAISECDALAQRKLTDLTKIQTSWYDAKTLIKILPSYNTQIDEI